MTSCEDNDFPCQDPRYNEFDKIAATELNDPIKADTLVNHSEFCMVIPVDRAHIIGDLDHKLFLRTLRGQAGLYHLWVDHDACNDHNTYTMLCAYVGKGPPEGRIASHIKSRWPGDVQLFATFTRMENRMAKYYEQLFLDCYDFHLNTAEKRGTDALYAVWDEERYTLGTHSNEVSQLSSIEGFSDIEK